MSSKHYRYQVFAGFILIGILIAFLSPQLMLTMPTSVSNLLAVFLCLAFIGFLALVWMEQPKDEREDYHRLMAGRLSFLAGASVLTVGIVLQSLKHEIDPLLILALIIMVLTKIAAQVYSKIRH